jgi:hypothetical protein
VVGSCEHSDEPTGSTKDEESCDCLKDWGNVSCQSCTTDCIERKYGTSLSITNSMEQRPF